MKHYVINKGNEMGRRSNGEEREQNIREIRITIERGIIPIHASTFMAV